MFQIRLNICVAFMYMRVYLERNIKKHKLEYFDKIFV